MADSKVVLITGTRKGIGRYLAEHFINQGHQVIGCSRGPIDWTHANYQHHQVDVSNEQQVKALIKAIKQDHQRLDIVINNAGIAAMNHSLLTPAKTAENIMATNFHGTFLICREAAKLMRKHNYGRIVNVSTVAVPLKIAGEAIYAASKNAVNMLSQILAHELAEFGITCNVIGPTPIATDLIRAVPKAKIDKLIDSLAIKRLGEFKDVANVIDFFVKPESDYITGQVIYLGGAS